MSRFCLPDLGEGLREAEIIEWAVAPGDRVEAGQILVTVETDKAIVDIPAPRAGTIAALHGAPGEAVEVGAALVDFGDGESADSGALVGRLPAEAAAPRAAAPAPAARPPRVKAMPAVRARARSLGIDLTTVVASGADGQVTTADLERAAHAAGARAGEPLRGPRRAMARNMARAHSEVAAATVTDEVVVSDWSLATDVTVLLVEAIAVAAVAEPALNAWFDSRTLNRVVHDAVHVGIAMDTPQGLFVPVLRNAGSRDAGDLRGELQRMKNAVLARDISRDDLHGATITLSNFGTIGGRHAALLLMPPQVAIVGAGAVSERVVAIDGQPAVRPVLPLSLTFDHRVVSGGEAARFLAALIAHLGRAD